MDWMARMDDGMVRQERNPWEVLDERFGEMIGSFETMRARFREAFREGMSAAADAAAAAKAAAVAAETVALAEQVPVELAEVEQEAQEQVPLLAEGTVAGDWLVRGFLARGGSSEVYCASHRVTGAPAVLKVLWNDNPRLRERFHREQEFLEGNPGPAFPALYGTGTTDGHPWIALERLDAYDPLPESEADVARYMLEIIEGVAVLHAKGLLHRDIKPANVMRRPSDGRAVLIDFGLIKPFGPESPVADSGELSVVDGQVLALGTPGYAAPE